MRVALFPGQGSLRPGMGIPWRDHSSFDVVEQISEFSGVDVRHLVEDATADELVRTDNAQLATFALSAVVADAAQLDDVDAAIGHSLGEYSALHFAGILDLRSATSLVVTRGRAMAVASAQQPGTMVAVLGADDATLARVLSDFSTLVIANQNAPGQTVLAGATDEIMRLRDTAKEIGLRKIIPLDVGGAFHSPLMAPAQKSLNEALASTTFHKGSIPVIANIDAAAHTGGDVWRKLLLEQLTGPVRFQSSIESLGDLPSEYVELGPGGVLVGLAKRIVPNASLHALATPEDVLTFQGGRS